jgi:PTS system mannose-specific IIA component
MSNISNRTAAIVVTHGRLAAELVRTTVNILGKVEDLYFVCSEDYGDSMIVEKIKKIMEEYKEEHTVLFADYSGGSCFLNCARATAGVKGVKVISGVNLPILLDFVTKRSLMNYEEMTNHLVKRGRDSINGTS